VWVLVVTQQSDQAKARLSPAQTPWPLNRTRSRARTSGRPQPSFALGSSEGTPGTDLCKGLTFSDASVNAGAERSCSQMCSHTAESADVRPCSPASKSLVALRIRSLANGGEHAAEDWGSRGRRFKSCHPDGKQQVRGRFGQNPRRPLCCRVAIGVATAHVLTSPLLLRAAGRRSAPSVETAARRYAVAPPPRACARQISATACADQHRSFPKPWLPLIARSAS